MAKNKKRNIFEGLAKVAKGITQGMQQMSNTKAPAGKKKPCGGCSGK